MKKYIKISTVLLVVLLASSCEDFLSPEPTSVSNAETFFESEADLELAAIALYDAMQGVNSTSTNDNHGAQVDFYVQEMLSDNTRSKNVGGEGESAQFESFTVEATNGIVDDYYRSNYQTIYRANVVLENLSVAGSAASRFEAEAKFVRAYAYFNLVRSFGDVPLVTSVIGIADTAIQFTRVDSDLIYDVIIDDLTTAVAGLDNTYKTRASKAAAQALLAKVYLTTGTNYGLAQTLCESVMGEGFVLEPNFKDVFYSELNNEIIFAIDYVGDSSADSQNFSAEWLNAVGRTAGVNYTTQEVRDALDALGGDRTLYSYRQDPLLLSQFQVAKFIPNGDDTLGIAATSSNPTLAGNDLIVLRYADVLLMHVEAIMAGQQSTSAQAALDSFEEVRLRAGLVGDADGTITKQELLDERRVELAFENQRFFDLVRFNVAQDVLSTFSDNNGYNFSVSDLLLPIPQREINLSQGALGQNPGY
ncbi:RagB/SusD family nutrient uptake outer membrane protein [Olleya sp. 1-3]|uniref:RagB/SusD family nutrient uptake outer membrane protein n=1 Tax=Olleya sp. 1-3 TaxID=2058323 RepID=UPI000C342974|nr:RagB/SusD family nutrient uptake outer membrane protein [Olleya sp. 1-3]PKG50618.1 RagB/SusD family nutrient uptake outer membrane protein [Olleya sp. 1-3]